MVELMTSSFLSIVSILRVFINGAADKIKHNEHREIRNALYLTVVKCVCPFRFREGLQTLGVFDQVTASLH